MGMKQPFESLPNEIWKPIATLPSYQVSNLGRVASFRQTTPFIKRYVKDARNYCRINLCASPGKLVTKYVHILVAHAFLGPPPPNHEIDHINGDASDNRLENLRYVSHQQNILHAMSRRGNWLKSSRKTFSPITQIMPDGSVISHTSIASACRTLGLSHTASANLCSATKSGNKAYGFHWSKPPVLMHSSSRQREISLTQAHTESAISLISHQSHNDTFVSR